jgi:hypothetical protein
MVRRSTARAWGLLRRALDSCVRSVRAACPLIIGNLSLGSNAILSGLFSFQAVAQMLGRCRGLGAFRPGKGKAPYPCPWRDQR